MPITPFSLVSDCSIVLPSTEDSSSPCSLKYLAIDLKSTNAYSFPNPILSPAKYKRFLYSSIICPAYPA
nr:MAG TPA: hypothetical protein [Caudoviricetes sp.]